MVYNKREGNIFDYDDRILVYLSDNKCSMERGVGPRIKEKYKVNPQALDGWNGHGFAHFLLKNLIFLIVCGYQKTVTKNRLLEGLINIRNTFRPCKLLFAEKDFEEFEWNEIYELLFYVFGETQFDILVIEDEGLEGSIEDPDMEKINYEKEKDKELSKKYV